MRWLYGADGVDDEGEMSPKAKLSETNVSESIENFYKFRSHYTPSLIASNAMERSLTAVLDSM
jgi:hypothetical protein